MTGIVEKNYSDALFQVVAEDDEKKLSEVRDELVAVAKIFENCPDFIKLANTPTISLEEKQDILKEAFGGKVSECVFNFLMLLTEAGRLNYFGKIKKAFCAQYDEHFNIAEITVTSALPLNDEQRKKITVKMSELLGKTIVLNEKPDAELVGGIVVDYGDRRFDGSVKSKLEALKLSLGEMIG